MHLTPLISTPPSTSRQVTPSQGSEGLGHNRVPVSMTTTSTFEFPVMPCLQRAAAEIFSSPHWLPSRYNGSSGIPGVSQRGGHHRLLINGKMSANIKIFMVLSRNQQGQRRDPDKRVLKWRARQGAEAQEAILNTGRRLQLFHGVPWGDGSSC